MIYNTGISGGAEVEYVELTSDMVSFSTSWASCQLIITLPENIKTLCGVSVSMYSSSINQVLVAYPSMADLSYGEPVPATMTPSSLSYGRSTGVSVSGNIVRITTAASADSYTFSRGGCFYIPE